MSLPDKYRAQETPAVRLLYNFPEIFLINANMGLTGAFLISG